MESKHFRLTEETIVNEAGVTLHRIEATRDSYWALAGEKGGFVEMEGNLQDDAWVFDSAQVWGTDTALHDRSLARGNAKVYGGAKMWDDSVVQDDVRLFGFAYMSDNARAYHNAEISSHFTKIYGRAVIGTGAQIKHPDDYILFQGFLNEPVTVFRTREGYSIIYGYMSRARYFDNARWFAGYIRSLLFDYPTKAEEARLLAELIEVRFGESK